MVNQTKSITYQLSLLIALVVCFNKNLSSQNKNPYLLSQKDKLEIPFQYINGLIVIEATLQNEVKTKLLVDTGAENLILFNKSIIGELNATPTKRVVLKGADLSYEVSAQICRNISLELPNSRPINKDFIVLDENYLKLDEALGIKIDGLIGGRLFWGMVLEIDYKKRKLRLYSKDSYLPSKSPFVEKFDLEMANNKPYLEANMSMYAGSSIPIKLLIDTGSAMGLLLFLNTHPQLLLPDVHLQGPLGRGLGGDIVGYLAKTKTLRFCKSLYFNNLLTNYQNIADSIHPEFYNDRNGILGNPILSKFKITIDYVDQLLYMEAIENYNKELTIDKTGLIVIASGPKLNDYVVKYVLPNTPAEKADLREGDIIKRVGIMPTKLLSLSNLNAKFAQKEGKSLRLKLLRNDTIIKKKLILEDYLKVVTKSWGYNPL